MKLLIHGFGQMGRMVAECAADFPDIEIIGVVDGQMAAEEAVYPLFQTINEAPRADGVIDFSHPDLLADVLRYGIKNHAKLVLATTGYLPEQLEAIKEASQLTAIVQSYNMSFGIAVLQQILAQFAPLLRENFDIEIIEKHHRKKIDAPSGTAKLLYDAVASEENHPVYERESIKQPRTDQEIGMHSVRGGTIFGEHTVLFAGMDEIIELKHEALSKKVFANGSLKAVLMLQEKAKGLFTLEDLYKK